MNPSKDELRLGLMYAHGRGVPQDYTRAFQLLRNAAEQGDTTAEFELGQMYYHGRGVLPDVAEAAHWYCRAAGRGDANAQLSLGGMYEDGLGVSQDDAEAVRWYYKAAEQGDIRAASKLRAIDAKHPLPLPKPSATHLPSLNGSLVADREKRSTGVVEQIKSLSYSLVGILVFILVIAIASVFVFGMTWASAKVFPWLMPTVLWTLAVCLLVFAPSAALRRTRGFSAIGLLSASYVLGAVLWISSLLLTMSLWGVFAVVFGLLFMGVGIVPVAILAAIFHAEWSRLGDIVIMLAATFGVRAIALWLVTKTDRDTGKLDLE